ncbi:MAG TPA: hypothetical protein ENN84_05810 [Candidatus Marinimicrobia bacterium]|nr:hypothetical protein [Candidatus Neomarinimicrobiota bacterium]
MKTYFAPAERADKMNLEKQIAFINDNPIFTSILDSMGGLLAVLNEHRQVLAINQSLLKHLNIHNSEEFSGLRPGELLDCVYSALEEGGCGTSKYCSSCGAAIAIVSSLTEDKSKEKICALRREKDGQIEDRALLVRCTPFVLYGKRLLLLFLQDISEQEQRAALETIFFHDIANMLSGLLGAAELMDFGTNKPELSTIIRQNTVRLI